MRGRNSSGNALPPTNPFAADHRPPLTPRAQVLTVFLSFLLSASPRDLRVSALKSAFPFWPIRTIGYNRTCPPASPRSPDDDTASSCSCSLFCPVSRLVPLPFFWLRLAA